MVDLAEKAAHQPSALLRAATSPRRAATSRLSPPLSSRASDNSRLSAATSTCWAATISARARREGAASPLRSPPPAARAQSGLCCLQWASWQSL
eukprot:CAMPEP_0182856752 /NCGR_PEP_ID=MMETSP0034_2-20130328/2634_1 /TAXON_ID=156128 /ORGANISM="Nephroselmis pyriformis, Strain CCMP717" /LENGTH=93 /DNA_ID=CAMNT_0024987885 /DNA_START=313 /DNA_END=592 /DNA_ORIENTATION=+